MSVIKTYNKSFAGGEIAPELAGRIDLDKWQTALQRCRNWIPLAHGPIRTRPGTRHVMPCPLMKRAQLIPFQWSLDQTMMLEFGEYYIHFHSDGATLFRDPRNMSAITTGNQTKVSLGGNNYNNGDIVLMQGVTGSAAALLNNKAFIVSSTGATSFFLRNLDGTDVDTFGTTATITGATIQAAYRVVTPYAEADLINLSYEQNSDVLTIVNENYPVYELKRYGLLDWRLELVQFVPGIDAPKTSGEPNYLAPTVTQQGMTVSADNPFFSSYVVTAVTEDNEESEPSNIAYFEAGKDITTITIAPNAEITLSTGLHANVKVGAMLHIAGLPNGTAEEIHLYNLLEGKNVEITSITVANTKFKIDVNTQLDGTPDNTAIDVSDANAEVYQLTCHNTLTVAGTKNKIAWGAVTGASYYKVYKATVTGGLYGFIGRTSSTTFTDSYYTPDFSKVASQASGNAFAQTNEYPRAVSYFEQRRIFGGTKAAPQTVWMTKTGTESNLLSSVPSMSGDAIRFRMSSRDHNAIQHIVPMNDLIILTSAAEWRAYAPNGEPITAPSLVIRPQSFSGCNSVRPVLTSGSLIYCQFGGYALRELAYSWEHQSYKSTDLSAMVPHLFEAEQVIDMAFQRVPIPIVWAVMTDGSMLSMTYMPEHKVIAYAVHTTDGLFESVSCVAEGNEDRVYVVVNRGGVRYIERFASFRPIEHLHDNFQLDAGMTLESATPVTSVTGLQHLEGKTVSIMTDGAVHPQRVVVNGTVTLDYEASIIHVGLPYTCLAQGMPLAFELSDAGVSNVKAINGVTLRVRNTSGLFIGMDEDHMVDVTKRATDQAMGEPTGLFTGMIQEAIIGDWNLEASLIMKVVDPVPAVVQSVAYEVAVDVELR